jgi:ankyrin repeat protein
MMTATSFRQRARELAEADGLDEVLQHLAQSQAPLPEALADEVAFSAARAGDIPVLEYLASGGALARLHDHPFGPLRSACCADQPETVEWLLGHGFPLLDRVTETGEPYSSILHFSIEECSLRIVQILVQAGAPLNLIAELGGHYFTPMSRAYDWSRTDLFEFLNSRYAGFPAEFPEFRETLYQHPEYCASPLQMAIDESDYALLGGMLDRWPEYTTSDQVYDQLVAAARQGAIDCLEVFVRHGLDLNRADSTGARPIKAAASEGNWHTVRWLIENGATAAPNPPQGWLEQCDVLSHVIRAGQNDLVRLIVERGAPLHAVSQSGIVVSALSIAIRSGNADLLQFLRERGALEEHEVPGYVHPFLRGEREWFGYKTPDEMIGLLGITRRNYLLFTFHCLHRLDVNRRHTDTKAFLDKLVERAENRCTEKDLLDAYFKVENCEHGAVRYAFVDDEFQGCGGVAEILSGGDEALMTEELARMADLLREIVGNPYRLRPERLRFDRELLAKEGIDVFDFDARWRMPAVLELALRMYDRNDFTAMPELGDALERAGCSVREVLDHCRAGHAHVRGCWLLDLILKKDQLCDVPEGTFRPVAEPDA